MTLLLSCLAAGGVQGQTALLLMPLPQHATPGTGEFVINNGFGIAL
jgi:hypothetical protein